MSNIAQRVRELFLTISKIPRPSYHEEKIADYICEFAKNCGHDYYRDGENNVFVKLAATEGYEEHAPVLLQGHTDMVCEKNEGTEHDFLTEGIKVYEENGWLTAEGTTLGADNGVAVAIMLCAIEGGFKAHPPIECLFTTAEEVGLDGAKAFDYSKVAARKLINMDGENENVVIVGSAGGVRTDVTFNCEYEALEGDTLEIKISGLYGGHSGENINSGRANANIIMGRLLAELSECEGARLVDLRGGSKDNAIPREAVAVVAVKDVEAVKNIAKSFEKDMALELNDDDKNFAVNVKAVSGYEKMLDANTAAKIITFISVSKNGIIEMSKKLKGLVEYSRNLGVIRTEEGKIRLAFSSRSAIDRQLDAAEREIRMLAELLGAECNSHGRYPGWVYNGESELADEYIKACHELFGKEVKKITIHAGIECSTIKSKLPDMDPICCGPNMKDLHSPDEAIEIESFARYTQAIERLLANL